MMYGNLPVVHGIRLHRKVYSPVAVVNDMRNAAVLDRPMLRAGHDRRPAMQNRPRRDNRGEERGLEPTLADARQGLFSLP